MTYLTWMEAAGNMVWKLQGTWYGGSRDDGNRWEWFDDGIDLVNYTLLHLARRKLLVYIQADS